MDADQRKRKAYANYTILLVDDEPDLVEIMKMVLENEGFHVHSCGSGGAAIAYLDAHYREIDFVITDYRMPEHDGLEVMRAAINKDRVIPVIVLSGYMEQGVVDALVEGAAAVHAKPIRIHEILKDINHWIESNGRDDNVRQQVRELTSMGVELFSEETRVQRQGQSLDITAKGIGITGLEFPLIINDSYRFRLVDPTGTHELHTFEGDAVCVWQRPTDDGYYKAGFKFTRGTSEAIAQLSFKA